MDLNQFKEYLDYVVTMAFKKGVLWMASGTNPMPDAIKQAQDEILECKH